MCFQDYYNWGLFIRTGLDPLLYNCCHYFDDYWIVEQVSFKLKYIKLLNSSHNSIPFCHPVPFICQKKEEKENSVQKNKDANITACQQLELLLIQHASNSDWSIALEIFLTWETWTSWDFSARLEAYPHKTAAESWPFLLASRSVWQKFDKYFNCVAPIHVGRQSIVDRPYSCIRMGRAGPFPSLPDMTLAGFSKVLMKM